MDDHLMSPLTGRSTVLCHACPSCAEVIAALGDKAPSIARARIQAMEDECAEVFRQELMDQYAASQSSSRSRSRTTSR